MRQQEQDKQKKQPSDFPVADRADKTKPHQYENNANRNQQQNNNQRRDESDRSREHKNNADRPTTHVSQNK